MNIRNRLVMPLNHRARITKVGHYALILVILLVAMMVAMPTVVYAGGEDAGDPPQGEQVVDQQENVGEGEQTQNTVPDGDVESYEESIPPQEATEHEEQISNSDKALAGDAEDVENPQLEQANNGDTPTVDSSEAESETAVIEKEPIDANDSTQTGVCDENAPDSGDASDESCTDLEPDQDAVLPEEENVVEEAESAQTESNDSAGVSEDVLQSSEIEYIPDPFFFVGGNKYSFLPEGGNCEGVDNCSISNTPIQDALNAVAGGLAPDDGTLYIEGGIFEEDIFIENYVNLTLQGSANDSLTTLAGEIQIVDSQQIVMQDFTFLKTIILENSTEISIIGTDLDDKVDVTIVGSSQVEIDAEEGDDEIAVHGSHGEVDVEGGAGDDVLAIDFVLDDDPADAIITFDGGDDFDSMQFQGGNFISVDYRASDPSSGTIDFDAAHVIYTNIEPIVDTTVAASATFPTTTSGTDDTIDIIDGGIQNGFQTIKVQGITFEDVSFANKTSVTVDGASGDDTITVKFTKLAVGLTSLTVKGGGSDGDKINVSGIVNMDGGDLTLDAETVTVNDNATISTRDLLLNPVNYETDPSEGDSGKLELKGSHITIGTGAKLLAHVEENSTYSQGNIYLKVNENAGIDPSFANLDSNSVSILVKGGAVLRGGKVELSSTVDHSRVFQYQGDESDVALNSLAGFVENLTFLAAVSYSSVESTIEVKPTAKIYASSFYATASGIGSAQAEPSGLGISVAFASVKNRTKVIIGGDVTTTGDAYINAGVDNTVMSYATTYGLHGGAAAIAITMLDSEATTHITDDANLKVNGDLTIQAVTVDRTYNYANSSADEGGALGIAAAIGDEISITNTFVDGIVEVGGDLSIYATHTNKFVKRPIVIIPQEEGGVNAEAEAKLDPGKYTKWLRRVRAGTGALEGSQWTPSLRGSMAGSTGTLSNFLSNTVIVALQEALPANKGTPPFQLAAAVAVAVVTKKANVRVGDGGADGDSNNGALTAYGSITIQSIVANRPKVNAISNVENGGDPTDIGGRKNTKFAGSAAVTFGKYINEAKAFINKNATVDARFHLLVNSQALNDLSLLNLGRNVAKNFYEVFIETPDHESTD
ncbi:MAG: hypothetical protein H8D34_05670, partial [Chloroflexi bacterium]|nr:hypothetical protein [Chloroflexota bacterium]